MTQQTLLLYGQLLREFRNGWQLIRTLRGGPISEVAVLWDGTRIVHPPGRVGLVEIAVELWLEQPYTRSGFYRPGDGHVIVDAGANIGLFSIWAARRNPRGRVVSLEPFPENFEYLTTNLRSARFGPDRVSPHQVALGRDFGQGHMISVGTRSLDHTLAPGGDRADSPGVLIVPISGLFDLAKADRIALLKVDIEGSEYDAFEHVDKSTLERIDRIAIEYHDNIRPGTLSLLESRLSSTHRCTSDASPVTGCGILLASRL
jgi:FkbM family methyltransferase